MTHHESVPALLRDGAPGDTSDTYDGSTRASTTVLTAVLVPRATGGFEDYEHAGVLTTITTERKRLRGGAAYVTSVRIVATGLSVAATGRPRLHPDPGIEHAYTVRGARPDGVLAVTTGAASPARLRAAHTKALAVFEEANTPPDAP